MLPGQHAPGFGQQQSPFYQGFWEIGVKLNLDTEAMAIPPDP